MQEFISYFKIKNIKQNKNHHENKLKKLIEETVVERISTSIKFDMTTCERWTKDNIKLFY